MSGRLLGIVAVASISAVAAYLLLTKKVRTASSVVLPFIITFLQKEEESEAEKDSGKGQTEETEEINDIKSTEDTEEPDNTQANFILDKDRREDEEEATSNQESMTTSLYEVVTLNDVPREEILGEQFVNNREDILEVKLNEPVNEVDSKEEEESQMNIQEELLQAEQGKNSSEEIEQIEFDDKSGLSESIIIVENEPEEKEKNRSFSGSPEMRRITRGFLNNSLIDDEENNVEDNDFTERGDDSTDRVGSNSDEVDKKEDSEEEKSGNDEDSALNESFKVDLRPSWMVNKTSVKRMKESTASI